MPQKRSKDYIPSYTDFAAKQEAIAQYRKDHPCPYKWWRVNYTVSGMHCSERMKGISASDAIKSTQELLSKLGMYGTEYSATCEGDATW